MIKIEDCKKAYLDGGDLGLAEFVADNMMSYFKPVEVPFESEQLKAYRQLAPKTRQMFAEGNAQERRSKEQFDLQVKKIDDARRENESHLYWLRIWADLLRDDQMRYARFMSKINEFEGNFQREGDEVEWED